MAPFLCTENLLYSGACGIGACFTVCIHGLATAREGSRPAASASWVGILLPVHVQHRIGCSGVSAFSCRLCFSLNDSLADTSFNQLRGSVMLPALLVQHGLKSIYFVFSFRPCKLSYNQPRVPSCQPSTLSSRPQWCPRCCCSPTHTRCC